MKKIVFTKAQLMVVLGDHKRIGSASHASGHHQSSRCQLGNHSRTSQVSGASSEVLSVKEKKEQGQGSQCEGDERTRMSSRGEVHSHIETPHKLAVDSHSVK